MSKLNEYIRQIEDSIQSSPLIRAYDLHIDRKTEDIAYIYGRIEFLDSSLLDFKEFVAEVGDSIEKYKYAYNYRNQTSLVFRHDNASDPRARKLSTFPHHVHLPSDAIAESSSLNINDILSEIEEIIVRKA
ncbi:MAG TPA: DUF6516 family protein [Smithella sp.]|jgi:hypothetical protein|nr:DUF6516 family protein [Smithella sp.]